jgi:hypothetical protein
MAVSPSTQRHHEHPDWADRAGIWLSALCLAHCLLTPLALIFLPALALLADERLVHGVLLLVLPAVALVSFVPGFLRHRNKSVLGLAGFGLVLIATAFAFTHSEQQWQTAATTSLGSLFLISAHVKNRRLRAPGLTAETLQKP